MVTVVNINSSVDKDKRIKEIYENVDTGYGSVKDTFDQAKKQDSSIKYIDVKKYLDKQTHRQVQFKPKGQNSYISPEPLFEIEMDIIDMTTSAEENDGFRYALVAIDNFTKFAWAVPMKSKTSPDLVKATEVIFEKIGTPKQIYSDQEGGMTTPEYIRMLNKYKVRHITSVTGAHGVERFNRTLKENTFRRMRAMGLEDFTWTTTLKPVLNKYNNTVHRTIGMSPNDARKPNNKLQVWHSLWSGAKRNRTYPELKIGDKVRYAKTKDTKTKGYKPKWSAEIHEIKFINKTNEYVLDNDRKRLYSRHELLKV